MSIRYAAIIAGVVLAALAVFQLLLALGLPLAQFAWGGAYEGTLPPELRIASFVAIGVLALAAWLLFGAAGFVGPAGWQRGMTIGTLVFGAYFALNTLGNLNSSSDLERLVMTPVSSGLCILFIIVGIAGWRRGPN